MSICAAKFQRGAPHHPSHVNPALPCGDAQQHIGSNPESHPNSTDDARSSTGTWRLRSPFSSNQRRPLHADRPACRGPLRDGSGNLIPPTIGDFVSTTYGGLNEIAHPEPDLIAPGRHRRSTSSTSSPTPGGQVARQPIFSAGNPSQVSALRARRPSPTSPVGGQLS